MHAPWFNRLTIRRANRSAQSNLRFSYSCRHPSTSAAIRPEAGRHLASLCMRCILLRIARSTKAFPLL